MKRILALALLMFPFAAHAEFNAQHREIRGFAKGAGYLGKGSGESIRFDAAKRGVMKATIWANGGGLPGLKAGRVPVASGKFRIVSMSDGGVVKPIKQNGRVFRPAQIVE